MTDHNPCSLTFTRLAPDEETVFSDTLVVSEPHGSEFHLEDEARIYTSDTGWTMSLATYDCAVTPDFCDKLADTQEVQSKGGSVRFGL